MPVPWLYQLLAPATGSTQSQQKERMLLSFQRMLNRCRKFHLHFILGTKNDICSYVIGFTLEIEYTF